MNASAAVVDRVSTNARRIVYVTSGRTHGPITRLVSPSDIGQLLKPFVFLDHAEVAPRSKPLFGIHPHSGIATLTTILRGGLAYEDTTGAKGSVPTGGLEWMKAGHGVWHDGGPIPGEPLRVFQLWIALPPSEENAPAESRYVTPHAVQEEGPVRVVLGRHGHARSVIRPSTDLNYFHVRLKHGERWRYTPPEGHTVAWLAVDEGSLWANAPIAAGELAVFEESGSVIDFEADDDASFVLGSAIKHPYPLVLGNYSVHTNRAALARGHAEIDRIGQRLLEEGRLSMGRV